MTLRSHALQLLAAAALAAALPAAHSLERGEAAAGPGISYALPLAPHWQARFGMSNGPQSLRPEADQAGRSLSLFGDYYITQASGLRATGGLVLGKGGGGQSATLWPALGQRLSLAPAGAGAWWQDEGGALDGGLLRSAAPYLGLGYTGLAARGSLGFFADVGLRGLKPRSGVSLSGAAGGSAPQDGEPEFWRPWREWRFEPVLQLGVSYAF